jgi:hypothetical protein
MDGASAGLRVGDEFDGGTINASRCAPREEIVLGHDGRTADVGGVRREARCAAKAIQKQQDDSGVVWYG